MVSGQSIGAALKRLSRKRTFRVLRLGAILVVSTYVVAIAAIVVDGVTDSARQSDVIVILGNEVLSTGEPSERLAARLDTAADLYKKSFAPNVIVSGGLGASGFDEAEVMADYLIASGVPVDVIIEDPEGVTTAATATNAAAIMEQRNWDSVIVVSQYFHISRSRLAHKRAGIGSVTTASADYVELRDGYALAREVPAYAKYLIN